LGPIPVLAHSLLICATQFLQNGADAWVPLVSLTAAWPSAWAVASRWSPPVRAILFLSLSLLGVEHQQNNGNHPKNLAQRCNNCGTSCRDYLSVPRMLPPHPMVPAHTPYPVAGAGSLGIWCTPCSSPYESAWNSWSRVNARGLRGARALAGQARCHLVDKELLIGASSPSPWRSA
jgi:hypothetical protein